MGTKKTGERKPKKVSMATEQQAEQLLAHWYLLRDKLAPLFKVPGEIVALRDEARTLRVEEQNVRTTSMALRRCEESLRFLSIEDAGAAKAYAEKMTRKDAETAVEILPDAYSDGKIGGWFSTLWGGYRDLKNAIEAKKSGRPMRGSRTVHCTRTEMPSGNGNSYTCNGGGSN